MGRAKRNNENQFLKVTFTCTEHSGTEDLHTLILEPLVAYINESTGKEIVTVRQTPIENEKIS